MKTTPDRPKFQGRPKKPYSRPKLIAYGDIRELTQAETYSGQPDGMYPPTTYKTSGSPI